MLDTLTNILIVSFIGIMSVLLIFSIIKSIIGPTVADRIVSINILSTSVVMILCSLSVLFEEEGYLADIPIIYVLISFVATIVLSNVFINVNKRSKFKGSISKEDK